MMSETPQAVVRVTFLLGVTLLFAAIWQGDHPPGRRSTGASTDDSFAEDSGPRFPWDAPGSDLPEGESGEMVLRHAESDLDRGTWEQAGSLPPWTARGTDLPEGESGTMLHRHAESYGNRDDWERAGSRPPWTAPGTDLPQGESEYMARDDDREASTSVKKFRSRTLSSRPESHLMLASGQPVRRNLRDVALSDLPPEIGPGTYQVVDNSGRTARITLSRDTRAGAPATSAQPLYESHPAPGQRVYWIRIDLAGSAKEVAMSRLPVRQGEVSHSPAATITRSAALLTGSLNRTPPVQSSPVQWLDDASRWMDRTLELVRALPAELSQSVRR